MQKIVRIVLTLLRQTYDSLPIDFYFVPKRKSVLEMSKRVWPGNVLRIWKKGVPAGTSLVAGHAGICNSIVKYYTQRNGICQSYQLDIWFNVMICTNQFLHTQIIIIAPRIGNALFDKRNHCKLTLKSWKIQFDGNYTTPPPWTLSFQEIRWLRKRNQEIQLPWLRQSVLPTDGDCIWRP